MTQVYYRLFKSVVVCSSNSRLPAQVHYSLFESVIVCSSSSSRLPGQTSGPARVLSELAFVVVVVVSRRLDKHLAQLLSDGREPWPLLGLVFPALPHHAVPTVM